MPMKIPSLFLPVVTVCVLSVATPVHADGDATRGAQAYRTNCTECHTIDKDDLGPRHAGVVGRRAGSVPGFGYSAPLKASTFIWDAAMLERWLTNPDAVVPGQGMDFKLSDAATRADIIAYLITLKASK